MKFAYFSHIWRKNDMTPGQRYEQLWRELALADNLKFDYGFCVEHHFSPQRMRSLGGAHMQGRNLD